MELGDTSRFKTKKTGAKSERDLIVGDIYNFFKDKGIPLLRRGEMKMSYMGERLSPFKTSDLYPFLSKLKESKNPAALFWFFVKPKT